MDGCLVLWAIRKQSLEIRQPVHVTSNVGTCTPQLRAVLGGDDLMSVVIGFSSLYARYRLQYMRSGSRDGEIDPPRRGDGF